MAQYTFSTIKETAVTSGEGTITPDGAFPLTNANNGIFTDYHRVTGLYTDTAIPSQIGIDCTGWASVPNDSDYCVVKARVRINSGYNNPTAPDRSGSVRLFVTNATPVIITGTGFVVGWGPPTLNIDTTIDLVSDVFARSSFAGSNAAVTNARLQYGFNQKTTAGTATFELFVYEIWLEDSAGISGDLIASFI